MHTILVAEDFQTSRKVIVNALSGKGYNILEAGNGAEALDMFDGRNIDLLVTDLNMPEKNGAELIDGIRGMSQYQYIPVLVLSNEVNMDKQGMTHEARVTAWIPKPFDLQRFLNLVEESLNLQD